MNNRAMVGIALVLMVLGGFLLSVGFALSVTDIIIYASLLAALVKLGLALWIYFRNPSAKVNTYFAYVFIGQAVWDLGKFFLWLSSDPGTAFFWARLSYSGYILSVFFMLKFVWAFLKKKYFEKKGQDITFYTPMVTLIILLWMSPAVISALQSPESSPYEFGVRLWDYEYGPVYNYVFIWFQILPFIYAFVAFVWKFFNVHNPDKKKQLIYLMAGASFPIMIGIPTGVILPAMGINLPPHNNILSLIMSILVGIGIAKYKFLSIQPVSEKLAPGKHIDSESIRDYPLSFGHSYLIKHEKSTEVAHKVMLTHLLNKHYGLIITAHNPQKIRQDYGFEATPIVWITDTETEHLSVEPIDIEQIYNTVKRFVSHVPNSFVMLDGLDYLITHNNFTKIHHLIKQIKKEVFANDSCMLVPRGTALLNEKQERILDTEFIILPSKGRTEADEEAEAFRLKKPQYIVVGHTPLAESIISQFEKRRQKITLVDKRDILVHYPAEIVKHVKGDPLSSKVLVNSGINMKNIVVLVTLEADSDVVLCINKIRQLSEKAVIIANIHNPEFAHIAIKAGANKVIPSSAIGGKLISYAISSPDVVRWIMDTTAISAKDIELSETIVNKSISGKKVIDLEKAMDYKASIIAVMSDGILKQPPADDYVVRIGDRLVIIEKRPQKVKRKVTA